jgi:phage virion morphogenesis protein
MSIKISVRNLNAAFRQLQLSPAKLRPILPAIAELIESDIKDNFDAGGRWSGSGEITLTSGGTTKWKPLAASTLKNKAKRGYRKILISTGELRNSIEVRPQGNSIVISSNKQYAAIHNFGGQAGRNRRTTIPARPFLVASQAVIDEALAIVTAALTN